MMNKKGLLGMIVIIAAIVILLIGAFLWFQIKNNGITISSGDLSVDINFDENQESGPSEGVDNKTEANETSDVPLYNLSEGTLLALQNLSEQ
jgi:hypothetical protein